jgi:hypothetical protein
MKTLHSPRIHGWDSVARSHISVVTMFFSYVLPMSLIPPLMLYYAGTTYRDNLLPALALNVSQLQILSMVFFVVELVGVFLMAGAIEFMANTELKVIHSRQKLLEYPAETPTMSTPAEVPRVNYHDAFMLAAIAPTPLWLAPLILFVPSFMIGMTIGALALLASALILYNATPAILKLDEKKEGGLFRYMMITGGMVAWAAMMYLTLITWSVVTSTGSF